jgi:hypothetical protein
MSTFIYSQIEEYLQENRIDYFVEYFVYMSILNIPARNIEIKTITATFSSNIYVNDEFHSKLYWNGLLYKKNNFDKLELLIGKRNNKDDEYYEQQNYYGNDSDSVSDWGDFIDSP